MIDNTFAFLLTKDLNSFDTNLVGFLKGINFSPSVCAQVQTSIQASFQTDSFPYWPLELAPE